MGVELAAGGKARLRWGTRAFVWGWVLFVLLTLAFAACWVMYQFVEPYSLGERPGWVSLLRNAWLLSLAVPTALAALVTRVRCPSCQWYVAGVQSSPSLAPAPSSKGREEKPWAFEKELVGVLRAGRMECQHCGRVIELD